MIEFLFILLGIVVGYNIRHEWQMLRENLVLELVDARVRRELEIANNLNQSLLTDIAALKKLLVSRNQEIAMLHRSADGIPSRL